MNTYLGVVVAARTPATSTRRPVAAGEVLYMEGYLYDRPEAKEAFRYAAPIAHANGRQVSLTLSDSFCVDRHRADFRALVADEVDILFGNEDELMSLYEVDDLDEAVDAVRRDCAAGRGHGRRRRAAWWSRPTTSCASPPTRSTRCSTPPAPATCSPPASCTATPGDLPARGVRPDRCDRRRRSDLPRRSPRPLASSCVPLPCTRPALQAAMVGTYIAG